MYPRLLIIDYTRVDSVSATGQLKSALLRDWPVECCLQLYGAGAERLRFAPDLWDTASDYFIKEDVDPHRIVKDFNPDVIYYRPVGDRDDLHALAMEIIDTLRVPFVTHMMDDWPLRMHRSNPERAERYDADLKDLFSRAFVNLSICDAMTNAFWERYETDFVAIANGVEEEIIEKLAAIKRPKKGTAPFRIRYMGGLAPDMTCHSVLDVMAAVETLRGEGRDVTFEIYTMPHWMKVNKDVLHERDGVTVNKSVDKERYYELIGESDACLIAYNFDRQSISYTRYSMANKLPEILASKALLLAYGPKQLATISYVDSLDIGVCVTERNQTKLVDTLRAVIDRPGKYRKLSVEARRRVQRAHRMVDIRKQFSDYLREAAVSRPSWLTEVPQAEVQLEPVEEAKPVTPALLAGAMSAAHAVVLPSFRDRGLLSDFLARAAWFFPQTGIDRLTVFVSREVLRDYRWQLPDGFDPVIKTDRYPRLERILQFVEVDGQEDDITDRQAPALEEAKLVYFYDSAAKGQWKSGRRSSLLAGKQLLDVDPLRDKNEGAAYLETASKLLKSRQGLVEFNKQAFLSSGLLDQRYERAIILATGPSVSDYRRFENDGAMVIVCNSIIKSREIMDRLQPQILVFADPIFHYGPSLYAAKFRSDLEQALERYDFTIVTPMKYYSTLLDTVPSAEGRMIAVPFERECGVVMDLKAEFRTRVTDNILTLLMLPLAYTFSDAVYVFGCDGRPVEDNTYFWRHQDKVQYAESMGNIKKVHPGFFVMSYDDYYARHMSTTERFVQMAESQGKTFVSGGFSYIPAMQNRTAAKRIRREGVTAGGQRSLQAMILDLGDGSVTDAASLALTRAALQEVSRAPVDLVSLQEEIAWWSDEWQDDKLVPALYGPGAGEHEPWSQALLQSEPGDMAPLTRALGQIAALDAQQNTGPARLRKAVEGLLVDQEGFIKSDRWEETRVSLSAVLSEAAQDGQAEGTKPGIYLNLSIPLDNSNSARRDQKTHQPLVLNGAAKDHIHLDVETVAEIFTKHLSSWQGLVYCRTGRIAALAEALKTAPWQKAQSIDLVVDISETLLDLSLRDQVAAGRALRWMIESGEAKLSTLRIRATSEIVARNLFGTSGVALEMAPPLDPAFRDKTWIDRRRNSFSGEDQDRISGSRTLVVVDGRSAKSRKIAEETAKTLAQEGGAVSLYVRGRDAGQAEAITEDSIGTGHLKTYFGAGLEEQIFDEAAMVVVVVQDLDVEQGFYDVVQKAVLFGLPLVLWSAGRLGARCKDWDLGVTYDRFDQSVILRAVRATRMNDAYYRGCARAAIEPFGEAASWRNAAADLFAAGQRPEVAGREEGLKPAGISLQGAVTHSGANSFSIAKGGGPTNLMFLFAARVKAGDGVRVEARIRTQDASLVPLRICRHGSGNNEGSAPDAQGWEEIADGEFLIWREYTFVGEHARFRAEIGSLKGQDLHLEFLDLFAMPLN